MTDFDFYLPIALVVLLAYILWSFNRRLNAEIARAQARYRDCHGRGFEASVVTPRIERLRGDYATAARARQPFARARMEKVARARCMVREISFFRRMQGVTATAQQSNEGTKA